ncbi:DDRGK domain-containing protein 1 [Malaya genurostris]|uniref:DDRGK domain-containing protein 1 n=1 Tax=Malaya genurostris TaxID=325434 RepID=UPI0026F38766|nr:DDRGK domain-containing protein 1 [Malaya genurostris]
MDVLLLTGLAVALLVILLTLFILSRRDATKLPDHAHRENEANIPRRVQVVRNQRNRARLAAEAQPVAEENDSADDIPHADPDLSNEKLGTKKRAKLEAKAEKKAQREHELKLREEQKKKIALAEEERSRLEEKEAEEEKRKEEAEKKAREDQERKEYEEYLRMKESFSVEEEGYDQEEEDEKLNQLQEFIKFIKHNKVIVLEDLAVHFKLKTQAVIDRITELQKEGRLSGVIDDRGKFIYISEEELSAVARFIKQRGRVSITELAENSSNLVNLTPVAVDE